MTSGNEAPLKGLIAHGHYILVNGFESGHISRSMKCGDNKQYSNLKVQGKYNT